MARDFCSELLWCSSPSLLEKWDVSRVTGMNSMFEGAESFNQPIEKWDVSHVDRMDSMFKGAGADVNTKDDDGKTPLQYYNDMVNKGQNNKSSDSIAKLLIKAGAK